MLLPLLVAGAVGGAPVDVTALAQRNASTLRMSTLVCADQVSRYLKDDPGIDRAIDWCRQHGVTHVYLESFRDGSTTPRPILVHARDRFRAAGFLVSGCVTTTRFGKKSTGWDGIVCMTDPAAQARLKEFFTYAASMFDEIMIDDFLFTDCQCPDCVAAKGSQTWSDYRRNLMLRLSKENILSAARAVNPKARVIIKYPCWHEDFQERGYDVDRETQAFDETWVGTETRGGIPGSGWATEPQYRAYWLMRWLGGIGGAKCGGGWYDWIATSPTFYLEQARQTVLGGARESMLFNFGALYSDSLGKQDAAALLQELPLHFELAQLIRGKAPRGLLGWKPMNSPAGPDRNLQPLLGMAGLPVTAAHEFDPKAPAFVFGHQTMTDPGWRKSLTAALATGKPVLVTPDAAKSAGVSGSTPNAVLLPAIDDSNIWKALESMPEADLNALRDRAMQGIGSFHAPAHVALYLFGNDVAVVESFRDEPARCTLGLAGWRNMTAALRMPDGDPIAVTSGATAEFTVPARGLVALKRAR